MTLPVLPSLPGQPADTPWPTARWQRGEAKTNDRTAFQAATDAAFELAPEQGVTLALLVVQNGQLVFERYDHGATPIYLEYSWSMAKSITHALVGLLVKDGALDVQERAAVAEWADDSRREITLHNLLQMRSGLEFFEDYEDGQASDVIAMLFSDGRHDTGGYAADKPLVAPPGERFSYSSGTTNIICRLLGELIGQGPTGMLKFMEERLWGPLGMRTPTPRFDTAGTFIGSSFLLATAEDFARFGYLYLRNGIWEDQQILPEGWVDYARTPSFMSDEEGYGAHWWLHPSRAGWFFASGYDGQRIYVIPEKDTVVVRLGRTHVDHAEPVWANVERLVDTLR